MWLSALARAVLRASWPANVATDCYSVVAGCFADVDWNLADVTGKCRSAETHFGVCVVSGGADIDAYHTRLWDLAFVIAAAVAADRNKIIDFAAVKIPTNSRTASYASVNM